MCKNLIDKTSSKEIFSIARWGFKNNLKAQTVIEYILLIGIVVGVLLVMSPYMRRLIQGLVKTVADQVGNQVNSEQDFEQSGYLVNSFTTTGATADQETRELLGTFNYIYDDETETKTKTSLNLGFTPNP